MEHNLDEANKLMQKISASNEEISPVSIDDIPLFEKFFKKTKHTYGNCWTYLVQSCYGIGPNKIGYKYYDGKNLSVVIAYPKVDKPEITAIYWIRPMGSEITKVINKFSKKFYKDYKVTSYVKKAFKSQFRKLEKMGWSNTQNYPWHPISHSEDDTYPEQIFEGDRTIRYTEELSRSYELRRHYIRAARLEEDNDIVVTDKNFEEIAWKLTNDFFSSDFIMSKKVNLSSKFDYYNVIFNNPKRENLDKKLIYVNGEPLGYYVTDAINKYTNLCVHIVLRDKLRYLVDWSTLRIFRIAKTPYINMGGSEDEGIHSFKQKFFPVKELEMKWATNKFQSSK